VSVKKEKHKLKMGKGKQRGSDSGKVEGAAEGMEWERRGELRK